MKKLFILSAMIVSTSAMAASDLYVNQAAQKAGVALQELQDLENTVPEMIRPLIRANLDAVKLQISGIQTDLANSLNPNAPGSQTLPPIATGFICSVTDSFNNDMHLGAKAPTHLQAEASAVKACKDKFGGADMWCSAAPVCDPVNL